MKKLLSLLSIALCALCFASCSSQSSPTNVTEALIKNIQNENYEAISELFYAKGETEEEINEQKQMIESLYTDKVKKSIDKKEGIKSYEIEEEKISEDGKTAIVKYSITYGNGDTDKETNKLVNIDGKWYIDLGK